MTRHFLFAALLLIATPAAAATQTVGSLNGAAIVDTLDVQAVPAGTVQRFWFRAGTSPVGQPWLVPVIVVKGALPGPRLLLTAGIHGDELNGIAVLHQLAAGIDPAKLSGTLTLVPGLNPPGLLQSTRQWTPDWSRSAPNLNREMPGKIGGSAIADFAGRLWQHLIRPNADTAIDLHTQSRGTAYMMYAFASNARTRRMAELVAPDIIKMDKGDKGTVENTLTDDGVPAITLELGRPEMFDDTMIARAEAGLLNLMRELKMLPGTATPPPASLLVANDIAAVRATKSGWARLLLPLGALVKKDQAIAQVRDAFGTLIETIVAPVDGRINMIATDPRIDQGGTIARIVWWSTDPACTNGC
ncbi:succinylglutamate desuccinylase/aspartoacylase family protein [Sandarakinorhabdus sp.]|uniref:succinylglutamate desuccinylase/aspartoacylase family protein n=1 Tax=Sandarakinorhabdus sp. TaxID=1916663 RepID=UPI0033418765